MENKIKWTLPWQIEELTMYSDTRGSLYETIKFTEQGVPSGGQLYVYTINPRTRRGDHFHLQKSEWFICVYGQVVVLMKSQLGGKLEETLDSATPRLAFAGPGTSHALVNKTKEIAVIVAYASKEFDKEYPDTFFKSAD